ncbi:hypothetical protein pEaSNUABM50_00332 [Erwinia phage pEa_SNUABM_50]|uniref:Uncharacterized protein n=4 Tax=Eneladusvirus BF TaxID=2560751 RepID=A0A7L8ZNF5_9CAUD|nr:hypothetical protein FDH34_gp336 [Serratia phage BF]QOI71273.1 hypothetical protein pEaSNUABM12_00335 [Erwinia phage pEa_SNUABM_12]QOI71817.1 hypothetical protein pEaSNUABM47_00333 [Erwinia phage pEa_SNUABM_47]QOI72356.1 hypothetical protein pEaSNUABM50_00332 [Erwinia phage pEa_SNUABM_50]QXO11482.1 hypothetical protein pEaSNUABM19_00336 [Erwinia phage pEa_SNUABM_19]QXO12030.1 hypothetical protein pEaSNUABM44_00334 [Erwinia phage pEa_SNUABM_44]QXO12583.1 hypothetical protein pEaSNUABM49_003
METGKYLVVSRDKTTKRCSMSASPKEHSTEAVAKAEAARLAQENQEKEFTVVRVVATATVAKVSWR